MYIYIYIHGWVLRTWIKFKNGSNLNHPDTLWSSCPRYSCWCKKPDDFPVFAKKSIAGGLVIYKPAIYNSFMKIYGWYYGYHLRLIFHNIDINLYENLCWWLICLYDVLIIYKENIRQFPLKNQVTQTAKIAKKPSKPISIQERLCEFSRV